jgi:Ser/Thr protein kinase RdoA (MazF antagonist)
MSTTHTDIATAVRQINAAHDTAFALRRRFESGEQGAFQLEDRDGARFVLKWQADESDAGALPAIIPVLDSLRAAGYPIPRYVLHGVLDAPRGRYSIQEQLPGRSGRTLSDQAVTQALALNELQAGRAAGLLGRTAPFPAFAPGAAAQVSGAFEPWRDYLPRLTLRGGDGFCHLDAMRAYSPDTAALLARLQDYVATHAGRLEAAPATDVVHFDFSPSNILVAVAGPYGGPDRHITGVVDWEGLVPGDRAFDLATLLYYAGYCAGTSGTRDRIWPRALDLVDAPTFGLYLCHMVHRQTDWSIRHHDAHTIAAVLRVAASVLGDVASRTGQPPSVTTPA